MDKRELLQKLNQIRDGSLSPEEMLIALKRAPFDDIGYAVIDNHRGVRQGFGEVIYGAGKTGAQIAGIARNLREGGARNILITRMDSEKADFVAREVDLWYHEMSGIGVVGKEERPLVGHVVVASGGTSDMAVCEEAALTLETFGNRVTRLYDVGVAGLHRLLARLDVLFDARCVVAVAGMEGALASVVGGLVDCPVVAVPTSIGYGANFGGVSALLSMLNSCASGVSVVNIDNGFGAGYLAAMINQMEGIK